MKHGSQAVEFDPRRSSDRALLLTVLRRQGLHAMEWKRNPDDVQVCMYIANKPATKDYLVITTEILDDNPMVVITGTVEEGKPAGLVAKVATPTLEKAQRAFFRYWAKRQTFVPEFFTNPASDRIPTVVEVTGKPPLDGAAPGPGKGELHGAMIALAEWQVALPPRFTAAMSPNSAAGPMMRVTDTETNRAADIPTFAYQVVRYLLATLFPTPAKELPLGLTMVHPEGKKKRRRKPDGNPFEISDTTPKEGDTLNTTMRKLKKRMKKK